MAWRQHHVTAAPWTDPQISQAFEKKIEVGEIEMIWPVRSFFFRGRNQPGLGVQLMYWSIVNGWCCPIGVLFFCGSLKNRVVPPWKWFIYLKKKKNQPCLFLHLRVNTSIRCNSDSGSMTHYSIPKKKQADILSYLPWHSRTQVWVLTLWRGSPPVTKAVLTQRGSSHPWQKSIPIAPRADWDWGMSFIGMAWTQNDGSEASCRQSSWI